MVRWTPLSCAVLGIVGLWLGNGWYFVVLGLLTLTGGFSRASIYDRLYNHVVRHVFRSGRIPNHGKARQFGCVVGGAMFILTSAGFFLHNPWLAYIPSLFIIVLALVAGLTHWCFASTLYGLLFGIRVDTSAPSKLPW